MKIKTRIIQNFDIVGKKLYEVTVHYIESGNVWKKFDQVVIKIANRICDKTKRILKKHKNLLEKLGKTF